MLIRVHRILDKTTAEGPGVRFCIWVQGCSRNCKGCFMKSAQSFVGGKLVEADELFEKIKTKVPEIEGVTFLGGEPFEQAEAVSYLAKKIKGLGLSVLTFTGFKYEHLLKLENNYINQLLYYTDLLIDGEFRQEKLDYSRALVGSSNQKFIYLTDRYSSVDIDKLKNKIEMRISRDGIISINGMADFKKLEKLVLD